MMRWAFLAALVFVQASGAVRAAEPANADAMVEAVRLGDQDRVRTLLRSGASVDGVPAGQWAGSPLFHALQTRQFAMARLLIEAGAKVTMAKGDDKAGVPLEWAARAGDAGIVRLMLDKGADAKARPYYSYTGSYGPTAMDTALEWGRMEVVKELEKAGVSVLGNDHGALALRFAGLSGYADCAEYLLQRGAAVDVKCDGNTALDGAVLHGNLAVMKVLLDHGADINGISDGEPLSRWGSEPRTPVAMAVLMSQREALDLLLKRGADARAQDNFAIKLADLLGDEEAWSRLRSAGAPEPGPYAFRDLAKGILNGKIAGRAGSAVSGGGVGVAVTGLDATAIESLSGGVSAEGSAGLAQPTRFAVIPLDADLADVESVLTAQLSTVEKAVVLERSELDALRKERTLSEFFGREPERNRSVGKLLGADALVLLQTYRVGEVPVVEARIVSTATGLVTTVVPWARDRSGLEAWAKVLANRCAAEGGRIHVAPKDARLVAVAPFTASLNTPAAREVERQLTVAVALRVARMPGVFLVEREVLERLRIENQTESRELVRGSWLLSGAVETSLNDDGVVLRLKAAPGGNAKEQELRIAGRTVDPAGIAENVGRDLGPVLAATSSAENRWAPLAEAEQWFVQEQGFFKRRMWEQAAAAGEAAWVLGLRDDRVRRLRVETITGRIKFYGELLPGVKRSRLNLQGLQETLGYRAPLLLPADGPREPTAAEYVEQANILLDLFEPTLAATRAKVDGLSFTDWAGGPVWDAATLPLKLEQPLSYRRDGLALKELGQRLIAASDRALVVARERGDAELWHTLVVVRCRNLAWWAQEDEAFFQSDVLRLLAEARAATAPYSQHAVWEPVHAFAEEQMASLNGSKGEAWVRLAHRLASSEDVSERFFGVALLNKEAQSARVIESNLDWMMEVFPELVAQDKAVPVLLRQKGYGSSSLTGGYYPKGAWYAAVLGAQLDAGLRFKDWWMLKPAKTGQWKRGPELREFYRVNAQHRMERIIADGASGMFPLPARDNGLSLGEMDQLVALANQARARFAVDAKTNPALAGTQAAWTYLLTPYALQNELKQLRKAVPPPPTVDLALGPQRILFEAQLAQMNAVARTKTGPIQEIGRLWDADGRAWFTSGFNYGAVFTFAPDGELAEVLLAPDGRKGDVRTSFSPLQEATASIDDRYFVSIGRDFNLNTWEWKPVFLLCDRRTGQWEKWVSAQPFHQVFDIRLSAGKVFFSFLHNPVIESADSANYYSRHYENDGDPLRGIMSYDPATKRFDLLVSSRRNPPLSPLDNPMNRYPKLIPAGPDSFVVEGLESQVYEARTEKWRASTPADVKLVRANRDKRDDRHLQAGGKWWRPAGLENGVLRFTAGGSEVRLAAPWEIDPVVTEKLKPYPRLQEQYVDTTPVTRIECTMTRDGLFIRKGTVYHWVPRAQVEAALTVALAATTAQNSSKEPR